MNISAEFCAHSLAAGWKMGNIRQTKRLLRGSLKEFPITMQSGILGFLSIRHNGKNASGFAIVCGINRMRGDLAKAANRRERTSLPLLLKFG